MTRPLETSLRAAVAVLCSLSILSLMTLALPTSARAADPAANPFEEPPTDSLSLKAAEHVAKAYEEHKAHAYGNAEAAFKRAAFFEPRWRPLHFNLGVVAEAQGNLGTAIKEYKTFRPFATPDEGMVVDQRILELDARRRNIAAKHRGQIVVGALVLSVGVGMMAGGGIMAGLNAKAGEEYINGDPMMVDPDFATDESKRKKLLTGGVVLALYGLLVVGLAFVPLSKAVRSKRQLDGLALGRTRLHLTGGGATLRF